MCYKDRTIVLCSYLILVALTHALLCIGCALCLYGCKDAHTRGVLVLI